MAEVVSRMILTNLANDAKAVLAANSSEWFNYLDFIQYVKTPSLIYVGSKEASVQDLADMSQQLKDSSNCKSYLHVFPEADHAAVYWRADLAAPVIKEFIETVTPKPRISCRL